MPRRERSSATCSGSRWLRPSSARRCSRGQRATRCTPRSSFGCSSIAACSTATAEAGSCARANCRCPSRCRGSSLRDSTPCAGREARSPGRRGHRPRLLAGCGRRGRRPRACGSRTHPRSLEQKELVRRLGTSASRASASTPSTTRSSATSRTGRSPVQSERERHLLAASWIESLGRREDHAETLAHHYLAAVEYAEAGGEEVPPLPLGRRGPYAKRAIERCR